MNNLEESTKISRETKWAVLGRELADRKIAGKNLSAAINEAMILRRIEQDRADRETRFAGLARQVGDAARNGKDTTALLDQLADLRRVELG